MSAQLTHCPDKQHLFENLELGCEVEPNAGGALLKILLLDDT